MTYRQQEIYERSRARATAGWHFGFLDQYKGDDLLVATLGYRSGLFQRIRLTAEIEEERRSRPLYSRRGI